MPDFWEFPTVSMGLGPINAIYQARFNHYLHDRGIKDTAEQHVWAFLGDGEMDEAESRGALQIAAQRGARQPHLRRQLQPAAPRRPGPRQRQDHPGARVVLPRRRLERHQGGLGPRVGRRCSRTDNDGALVNLMNPTPDGDFQTYKAEDGAYIREHFFGRDPRTRKMVESWTDDEIWSLSRGGHDYRKVYAAYRAATEHKGQPTVILAKTIKGWTLGSHFEGRNATHQMKKLTLEDLKDFRDRLQIPITDDRARRRTCRRTTTRAWTTSRSSTCSSGARRSAAASPSVAARPRRWRCPRTRRTTRSSAARASRRSPRPWRSSACSRT